MCHVLGRAAIFLAALCLPFPAATLSPKAGLLPEVAISELPREAAHTLRLIQLGGPFPHSRDGSIFHNRESRLPIRPGGYYREYTVPTPRARDRGPRRIVAALGATGDVRNSGEYYYSGDHYRSFYRIRR